MDALWAGSTPGRAMKGKLMNLLGWPFRKIWRGYTYVYYRLYAWNLATWGESDVPQFNAMYVVASVSYANLLAIATLIVGVTGKRLIYGAPKYQLGAMILAWAFVNYWALVRNGKYKRIAARFSKEQPTAHTRNMIFCWLYVILSIAGLVVSALLSSPF